MAPASQALFQEKPKEFVLPPLVDLPLDDRYDELEILDFPLCNPFEMADDDPHRYKLAKDLEAALGKTVTVLGYFIENKPVATVKNEIMHFCTFFDVNLDWIDTVHFPDSLQYYPLKGKGFYRITGKVVADFGVYSIEVVKLIKVGYKQRKYANL